MPEYGHFFSSSAGLQLAGGMQSKYFGHSGLCSQPQPQALKNPVVFSGHVNLMVEHTSGLPPT
jgi:hypothetical protein